MTKFTSHDEASLSRIRRLLDGLVGGDEHVAVDKPGEAAADQRADPVHPVAGRHGGPEGVGRVHGAAAEGAGGQDVGADDEAGGHGAMVPREPFFGSAAVAYTSAKEPIQDNLFKSIDAEQYQQFIMLSNALFQRLVKWCPSLLREEPKQPVKVLVTGAAGQIGYAIVAMIARGLMLGPDQPVVLHMLDLPRMADALNGVRMELIDAALPLLRGVVVPSDEAEAFKGVNFAVLIGGWPRREGMERNDLISKNVTIYRSQASALQKHAAPNCKVLVVANPANTNALVLKEFAPAIPAKNITCLTRLDHNRALGQMSEKLGVHVGDVKNAIVWGNHSSTQFPDASHATVKTGQGETPIMELVADQKWLREEFISIVQQRGAAVIKARKQSSSLSAANAACDHMRDWILGTPKGTWVSMGVYSDGSYGVPEGIFYSFPVTCGKGEWSIVQGLQVDDFARSKMELSANELQEEKAIAYELVSSKS